MKKDDIIKFGRLMHTFAVELNDLYDEFIENCKRVTISHYSTFSGQINGRYVHYEDYDKLQNEIQDYMKKRNYLMEKLLKKAKRLK